MPVDPNIALTDPCCVYGLGFDGYTYLVEGLFSNIQRIPLAAGQTAATLLEEIDPETRWFVWHSFLTYKDRVPRGRAALCEALRKRQIRTINEGVVDQSKRHTQAVLSELGLPTTMAAPEGDPGELLFFKSNHNYGGIAERRLSEEMLKFFGIEKPHPAAPLFRHYRVAERRRFSPKAFVNQDLFVERFVDNRSDVFYRAFVVFDQVILSRLVCKGIIKKALAADHREDYFFSFSEADRGFASAPDALSRRIMTDLHRFCRAFKLDMGGLDILVDDSEVPYIIDANPTAYGGGNLKLPGFLEHLAKGLHDRVAQDARADTSAEAQAPQSSLQTRDSG